MGNNDETLPKNPEGYFDGTTQRPYVPTEPDEEETLPRAPGTEHTAIVEDIDRLSGK